MTALDKPTIWSAPSVCIQALREPAAFSKPTGCDSEVPYEKVTLAQARKGTPGNTLMLQEPHVST